VSPSPIYGLVSSNSSSYQLNMSGILFLLQNESRFNQGYIYEYRGGWTNLATGLLCPKGQTSFGGRNSACLQTGELCSSMVTNEMKKKSAIIPQLISSIACLYEKLLTHPCTQ